MNEKQEEYTVKQIEKYTTESEQITKESLKWVVLLAAGFAITIVSSTVSGGDNIDPVRRMLGYVLSVGGALMSAVSLWLMVDCLCIKSGLENRIADLQYRLDFANLEDTEEKGCGL